MSKLTEDLLDMVATSDYAEVPKGLIQRIVKQLEGYEWKYFESFEPELNGDYEIICEGGQIQRRLYVQINSEYGWGESRGVGLSQIQFAKFPSPPKLIRSFTPFEVQQ